MVPGIKPAKLDLAVAVAPFRGLLFAILLLALFLRLWALDFGLPGKYRPDEEYLVSRAIGFHGGDFNPRFFQYPTLYMYALSGVYGGYKIAGAASGLFGEGGFDDYLRRTLYAPLHLVGRYTTAALGTVTVFATYRLGAAAFSPATGLLAAAVLAVNFSHVRESHFVTTDVPMTLFAVLTLLAIIRISRMGRLRDYLAAGALAGLATSVKYPAILLVVPICLAHLSRACLERKALWKVGPLVAGGLCLGCFFFAGSPYVLLDWQTFLDNLTYQAGFVRSGLPGLGMSYGWRWLFGFGLWYGAGPWIEGLALLGLLAAVAGMVRGGWRHSPGLILGSFCLAFGIVLIGSRWVFLRYVTPLMPLMAVFSARSVQLVTERFLSKRRALAISAALLALASFDPAMRSIANDRLLGREDTRSLAGRWIADNIPAGSLIAARTIHMYGKPQLPAGYRYVGLDQVALRKREAGASWVLLDEHPISFFSPPPGERTKELLKRYGRLEAEFDPFQPAASVTPIYDPPDAFYVPVGGFAAVKRPGPRIRIYRLREDGLSFLKEGSLVTGKRLAVAGAGA